MIIKRDGKKYELTADELRQAYYEQERLYDEEDVMQYIKSWDDDKFKDLGTTREQLEECYLEEIVAYKREYEGEQDYNWNIVQKAIEDALTYGGF